MLNRLFIALILVPLAVLLITFAVANRGAVSITFDPFNPGNPGLTYHVPLFLLLFAAMAVGLVVGGAATWFRQGRYRKLARQRAIEAEALKQSQAQAARRAPAGPALPKPATQP